MILIAIPVVIYYILQTLTSLYLECTELGAGGAEYLAKALTHNKVT